MEKDTLKEIGKFGLDIAKIIFAIAVLSPIIKDGSINWFAIIGTIAFSIGGIIFINKGNKNV